MTRFLTLERKVFAGGHKPEIVGSSPTLATSRFGVPLWRTVWIVMKLVV